MVDGVFAVLASSGHMSDGSADYVEPTYTGSCGIPGLEMSVESWDSQFAPNLRCYCIRFPDHVARGWDHVPFLYGSSCCACMTMMASWLLEDRVQAIC